MKDHEWVEVEEKKVEWRFQAGRQVGRQGRADTHHHNHNNDSSSWRNGGGGKLEELHQRRERWSAVPWPA